MMDLNRVAAFVRVVQDGSFTSAARTLGVPKSSVSRSVAQLEDDLGIRLLHRTTRKLHLTEAGSNFYEKVSRALGEIDLASAAATDTQAEARGTVRITAPVDLGIHALAPIIGRFVKKHPTIRVETVLTGRVVDMVAEGVDLAVRVAPLRDSSLVARRIGPLRGGLYASPKYLARKGTPKTTADLASHDCLVFRAHSGTSAWLLVDEDGRETTVEVDGSVAADDLMFVHSMMVNGAGIGLVPEFLCEPELAKGRLVRVLPKLALKGVMCHLVYPSARFVPQRVVIFRDFVLRELIAGLPGCSKARGDDGDD
jgi:DNA-binding transcriptional LysR family regulator